MLRRGLQSLVQTTGRKWLPSSTAFPAKVAEISLQKRRFTHSSDDLLSGATVSKWMTADDANMMGVVHGGKILQMVEEAGVILTTKYCNAASNKPEGYTVCGTTLARVERTNFLKPLRVGQVAVVHGVILFTSPHSIKVRVNVWSQDVMKGTKQLTTQALLWYVPFSNSKPHRLAQVPQMEVSDEEAYKKELLSYQALKEQRSKRTDSYETFNDPETYDATEAHTPAYGESKTTQMVHPSHCVSQMFCKGGETMYWMDECAGVAAFKHCGSFAMTVGIEAIDFRNRIKLGSIVELTARPVHTSQQTLLMKVLVDSYGVDIERSRAAEALFRFVSLNQELKAQPLPPLKIKTAKEREMFEGCEEIHKSRKA